MKRNREEIRRDTKKILPSGLTVELGLPNPSESNIMKEELGWLGLVDLNDLVKSINPLVHALIECPTSNPYS